MNRPHRFRAGGRPRVAAGRMVRCLLRAGAGPRQVVESVRDTATLKPVGEVGLPAAGSAGGAAPGVRALRFCGQRQREDAEGQCALRYGLIAGTSANTLLFVPLPDDSAAPGAPEVSNPHRFSDATGPARPVSSLGGR
jgi:hypothetical protein